MLFSGGLYIDQFSKRASRESNSNQVGLGVAILPIHLFIELDIPFHVYNLQGFDICVGLANQKQSACPCTPCAQTRQL
jgi:hypothetical protein